MTTGVRRVLVLAGFEPTGRVGLLADAATVREGGGQVAPVLTAVTAQGPHTFAVLPVSTDLLRAQLAAAVARPVHAVKLGMVPSRAVLRALQASLARTTAPWVVDPVVRTSRGQRLSSLTARDYLALAAPNVTLTPNALEAGWLLRRKAPRTVEEAQRAAEALLRHGFGAVVLKGGHLRGTPVDVLAWEGGVKTFARRSRSRHVWRGTGCRFASALALGLAEGDGIEAATRRAHRYLGTLLRRAQP